MIGVRKIALPLVPLLLAVAMLAPTSLALSVGASAAITQTPQEHQYGDPAASGGGGGNTAMVSVASSTPFVATIAEI